MARRLIPLTIPQYLERYYMRVSCNAWYDSNRFITEIVERPKIMRVMYVLTLSDNSEVTVDGSTQIEVELY